MKLFLALFILVGVSTGFWFYLCAKMHRLLRENRPDVYEELEKPTLFLNNSIRNGALFTRFLFGKRWARLGDPATARHGKLMMKSMQYYLSCLSREKLAGCITHNKPVRPRPFSHNAGTASGFPGRGALYKNLDKHNFSGGCLHITRLSDIDLDVLKNIVRESYLHDNSRGT